LHGHRGGAHDHGAGPGAAVAHHQPLSVGIALIGMAGEVVSDLEPQGHGDHLSGSLAGEIIQGVGHHLPDLLGGFGCATLKLHRRLLCS
jgi:hypothetical protein